MCSGKLVSLLSKYFLFLVIMLICAALFLIMDAYLKNNYALKNPDEARKVMK